MKRYIFDETPYDRYAQQIAVSADNMEEAIMKALALRVRGGAVKFMGYRKCADRKCCDCYPQESDDD